MKYKYRLLIILCALMSFVGACRKDPKPLKEESEELTADPSSVAKGFYLVNEGVSNMNKASVDYLDFRKGLYRRNIYNEANPTVVKGLGDVANDIAVYGSKLYVVVNGSDKVEVMDVNTSKKIAQINILNCRYITFHNGKVYVSAYLGEVGNPNAANGIVAQIDTATLREERRVEVGRQPEEMAVAGEKIYVANSGGYNPSNYERTVSVIDIASFKVLKNIDVAINLHRIKADKYGDLYVTSRGDYYDIPSKLFVIDTRTESIKKSFDIAVSNLAIDDDTAYFYSTEFSYHTGKYTVTYGMLDVRDEQLNGKQFITDGTEAKIMRPYGIAVNPHTKDIFVTDAKDYVSPGELYCFDSTGKRKYSVTTGDIPAHFAFVY
ncbi:YncE family protein [Pararcticibacter amylolyticus]|uniref:YncE family protein n=1 Tax=Pararcticibacter amylolyticus TaxID=2173175 RepID=A0A2U2PFS2_9SPHI|nr:YncE family protein [Pararcticibacter amylolyticus]PWG80258.1 hypothetical protein DDR33_13785 [Pararcticibacter amylolyticus]